MTRPELLSPAGDWDCLKAAVANGADAVYFGVDAFNARQRAENFRIEELGEVMTWLHERKVRGFLTFNVLVFSDELERAAALAIAAAAAGVDALIVQDVGLNTGSSTTAPTAPFGIMRRTLPPPLRVTQRPPAASTVAPSGTPASSGGIV